LNEEQRAQCEEEAMEFEVAELHQNEAGELLVQLYTRLIVRTVRAERNTEQQ
jgi:hypothetical protein